MRADAEFQCPPDFLVYPHDGSVIHPPQAWSPSSSAQQPIRQSSSPAAVPCIARRTRLTRACWPACRPLFPLRLSSGCRYRMLSMRAAIPHCIRRRAQAFSVQD